jgi:hypothetical protein
LESERNQMQIALERDKHENELLSRILSTPKFWEAIRNVCANRSGRGRPWQDLPEKMRQDYRAEAEAALQAVGVMVVQAGQMA